MVRQVSSIHDQLRTLEERVSRISDLHARVLNAADEGVRQQNEALLNESTEETRAVTQRIKNDVRELERRPLAPGQTVAIRDNQVC